MASDATTPGDESPAESSQPAPADQPTEAIDSAPGTTPIEPTPTTPVEPAPTTPVAAAAAPAGPSGPSIKTKLIAGAIGGAIVVGGVFFGLGYWTGDATNSDHHDHHHRMSNEWRQDGGGYGHGGPRMRHHMRGNEDMPMPPGMQSPGNGQMPGNGQQQAPGNGQQTPNGNGATGVPSPVPSA